MALWVALRMAARVAQRVVLRAAARVKLRVAQLRLAALRVVGAPRPAREAEFGSELEAAAQESALRESALRAPAAKASRAVRWPPAVRRSICA